MSDPGDFGDELPPDDKVPGQTGHVEDHNRLSRELAEVQSVASQLWDSSPNIRGYVEDVLSLPLTGDPGDSYLVGPTAILYAWSTATEEWVETTPLRGPQGNPGADATIGQLEAGELPPPGSPVGGLWWVASTDDVIPVDPVVVTRVGQASVLSGSTTSQSLAVPGSPVAGDFAVLAVLSSGTANPTLSAGWTLHSTFTFTSGTFVTRIYYRTLPGGAESVTSTLASAGRQGLAMTVLRNAAGIVSAVDSDISSGTSTIPVPSVTATNPFVVVSGWGHRDSGTVSQSVTAPAGLSGVTSAFGTTGSGGAISVAMGSNITTQTPGTAYDPGDWLPDTTTEGQTVWQVAIDVVD